MTEAAFANLIEVCEEVIRYLEYFDREADVLPQLREALIKVREVTG